VQAQNAVCPSFKAFYKSKQNEIANAKFFHIQRLAFDTVSKTSGATPARKKSLA